VRGLPRQAAHRVVGAVESEERRTNLDEAAPDEVIAIVAAI
jgi:hypothetical protein